MRTGFYYFGYLMFLTISSNCYASNHYLENNRVAYTSKVLQAFNESTLQNIYNTYSYIEVVDKNSCRSRLSDLRAVCLLSLAKKYCRQTGNNKFKDDCELYSDIIVVNKLSENTFVNRSERYSMLENTSEDYRTVMANKLQQKYARIITHFSLTTGSDCRNNDFNCLARGLDKFCLDYTNTQSLSWQYCMSASLWFIGTSTRD